MLPTFVSQASALSRRALALGSLLLLGLFAAKAHAVPSFARQTGQNCVACHAGGQFPELTPYGRMFKLTGYTLGTRSIPLAVMGVVSDTKTNKPATVGNLRDGNPSFSTASVFLAGKVTDNIGGFMQATYNNYAGVSADGSHYSGTMGSDNADLRYADRDISPAGDLVWGLTLNNNPSVQDVWNSAPAWGWGVVPGSVGPAGSTPLLAGGLSQQVAGMGAYVYWNKTLYAELSGYKTADGVFSFLSQGHNIAYGNQAYLQGINPYWRVALTHEWGPHNVMLGAMGMSVNQYNGFDALGNTVVGGVGETNHLRDWAVDAQYQYLLDPITMTVLASYIHEDQSFGSNYAANTPASNGTLNQLQLKGSFIYGAKYGTTLAYARGSGTNQSGSSTSSVTGELFWIPIQNVRVGIQRTNYWDNGKAVSSGSAMSDYNRTLFYVWGAY